MEHGLHARVCVGIMLHVDKNEILTITLSLSARLSIYLCKYQYISSWCLFMLIMLFMDMHAIKSGIYTILLGFSVARLRSLCMMIVFTVCMFQNVHLIIREILQER